MKVKDNIEYKTNKPPRVIWQTGLGLHLEGIRITSSVIWPKKIVVQTSNFIDPEKVYKIGKY